MDLIGYIILGMLFLIFGILLYIPGRWWVKHKLRNIESESEYKLHITSSGFALCVLMVFAWVIGLSQEHFSPGTEFSKFVSTWLGKLYYIAIVTILTLVFGLILQMLGFTLVRNQNDDE
jgi:Kef-type K+ transport system membrane component KefB